MVALRKFILLFLSFWLCCTGGLKAQKFQFVLVKLKGTVLVLPPGQQSWQVARKWMNIPPKAHLKTLSDSYADILVNRRALVRVKEKSEICLKNLAKEIATKIAKESHLKFTPHKGTAVELLKGRAFFLVAPGYKELPFVVETPIGIAGVAGTKFVVDLLAPSHCLVAVWRGRVLFWSPEFPEKTVLIKANEYSEIIGRRPPHRPLRLSPMLHKRYREIRKLRLAPSLNRLLWREPSSKYQGMFTRGYAPTVESAPMSSMTSSSMTSSSMTEGGMNTSSSMNNKNVGTTNMGTTNTLPSSKELMPNMGETSTTTKPKSCR